MDSDTPKETADLQADPTTNLKFQPQSQRSKQSQKLNLWKCRISALGVAVILAAGGLISCGASSDRTSTNASTDPSLGDERTEELPSSEAQEPSTTNSTDSTAASSQLSSASSVPSLTLVRTLSELSQVWSVATYVREDGHLMVAGGNAEGDIKIWDGPVNKLERVLIGHTDTVRTVAVTESGKRLISGSGDGIKIWEPRSGELLYSLPTPAGSPVWTVAISPDERTFISGDYNGTITVWDMESGEALYRQSVDMPVWSIAIAPDGKSFVSANDDGTIIQWDRASGNVIKEFVGHRSTARAVAITPDGNTLASGSWDTTIKLWDLNSGDLKATLNEHSSRVVTLAISPDGKTLASGSVDRTLKTWDLSTQQLAKTLDISSNWVLTVAFDPVEQTLISGGKDQDVKIWQ
ncbi:hypothetical protein S7335_3457 [Synechococcus sp. PCC 7335]|uniref:WD40 repeat domain-containing protein n=1 Tax=Synechococcus sp. (strain ATCC 29403 / PCC 7335) TaxID=91464 RepID=UPI00017ECAEE|nr:WD40 repeat domain-containing protein [Synechococcus sp. PCC 7335]EDX85754.1 hypothetical protein S7335_3457 [Synechococcus sp. PCC 7335]